MMSRVGALKYHLVKCYECNRVVPGGMFCMKCGEGFTEYIDSSKCVECGKITPKERYCVSCGKRKEVFET
jgi:hypothetical protein